MILFPRIICQLVFCGFVIAAALTATAQTAPPTEKVWTYVEQMPQLPGGGGSTAVSTFIQQHVAYPPRAERARAEGRVFVSFTVAASGKVENVAVAKGFRPDCDSAAVEGVLLLPLFEPGRQTGIPVPVRFTVPVTFRLQALAVPAPPANDSLLVYTYVQFMPKYRNDTGTRLLTEDLIREFKTVSKDAGCSLPEFPVYVAVFIGPSGSIYDVQCINNRPAPVADGTAAPGVAAQPKLLPVPECSVAALKAAAVHLPRPTPGSLNGRKVAVCYTLVLHPPFK